MEKYICDRCGHTLEIELEKTVNGEMFCPICKTNMLTEEEYKCREEMGKMIEEDTQDDNMTPEEDSREIIDAFVIEAMHKNLKELGNNKTFQFIEELKQADIRARYRKYFLLAGGHIPLGEGIII